MSREKENPYLLLGFFDFMVMGTLMTVFFPWSLFICLLIFGLEETGFIVAALIHDAVKTIIAVATGILILALIIFLLVLVFI